MVALSGHLGLGLGVTFGNRGYNRGHSYPIYGHGGHYPVKHHGIRYNYGHPEIYTVNLGGRKNDSYEHERFDRHKNFERKEVRTERREETRIERKEVRNVEHKRVVHHQPIVHHTHKPRVDYRPTAFHPGESYTAPHYETSHSYEHHYPSIDGRASLERNRQLYPHSTDRYSYLFA